MGFTKIKEEELVGRGVVGLPDRPSLSTLDMQKKFDELARDVIIPKFNKLSEELESSILDTIAEVEDNEEEGKIAGALALKELNKATAKTITIYTSSGFPTMVADIGAKWSEITAGTSGTVIVNNGATLYHGTYYKYSEAFGSIHMTDCSTGIVYVWNCNGGDYQLDEIGKAKDFLPLTGGTLSAVGKQIVFANGHGYVYQDFNGTGLTNCFGDPSNNSGYRCMSVRSKAYRDHVKDSLVYECKESRDSNTFEYLVFGEHNKPSGSYTGNGVTSGRSISTGGIGNVCWVVGNGYSVYVDNTGAIYHYYERDELKRLGTDGMNFHDGILELNASTIFNTSGATYTYQVL